MRLTILDRLRFLGGISTLYVGVLFAVVGALGVWQADWRGLGYLVRPVATVPGRVLRVDSTDYSTEDYDVHEITFSYVRAGRRQLGTCYSTDAQWRPGQVAPVQYCPGRPALARLRGTNNGPFGLWGLVIGPLLGILGLLPAVSRGRQAWRQLAVLGDAGFTQATYQRTEAITPRNDDSENYLMHYAYQAGGQAHALVLETSHPDHYQGSEPLAYQQAQPGNAVLLVLLPAFLQRRLTPTAL